MSLTERRCDPYSWCPPCPSALLAAFVTKRGTVKNHNPEDIEINECSVALVDIHPVELCYGKLEEADHNRDCYYIKSDSGNIELDLVQGSCHMDENGVKEWICPPAHPRLCKDKKCGYCKIFDKTFTTNYYLREYDMGDGEIWYDEWYDFCGHLKIYILAPDTLDTFCDVYVNKLFDPLYSPCSTEKISLPHPFFPNHPNEMRYPPIFDCGAYGAYPSDAAMACVEEYWLPEHQWKLVPACKLEVYYDEVHSICQADVRNEVRRAKPSDNYSDGGLYGLYWTDPATPPVAVGPEDDIDLSPYDTTLFASYVRLDGHLSSRIISTSLSCPEINNARDDWLATVNENIDNRVYAESPPYTMDETPSVHYLGWNPDPWGRYRTNCAGFDGGYEQRYDYYYTPTHRHTKTRCRIKITKPEGLTVSASGVVLKIKVIEQYKKTAEWARQYVFNSSNEPVTVLEEEVTLTFGQEYVVPDVTRNAKPIEFNPFSDCPEADADDQLNFATLNTVNYTVTTNKQQIEVRLISYICDP